jgi:hypothetical protein
MRVSAPPVEVGPPDPVALGLAVLLVLAAGAGWRFRFAATFMFPR